MKGYIYCKENKIEEIKSLNFSVKGWNSKNSTATFMIEFCNEKDIVIDSVSIPKTNYEHLKNQVETFAQGMEYIIKKLSFNFDFEIRKYERDTIWYYSRNLELSRRRIRNDILMTFDNEEFEELIKELVDKFNTDNNCEAFLLGEELEHCCVIDNAKNRLRYEELRLMYNKYQDSLIEFLNQRNESE